MSRLATRPLRSWISHLAVLVTTLGLLSCATTPSSTTEKLDPLTGVTITYAQAPLLLYRDDASSAAYARNFANLGPIQINRSGTYRYFLWVGIWNTMTVADVSAYRNGFDSIVVFADGEPLLLEIAGWTPDAIGVSENMYLKPVASAADAYYEVTADQIRLIAEASDIRIQTGGNSPKEFNLWDSQSSARSSFAEFMRAALL